jgi:2-polyprenyl-3-methyl-5-hydroxy-6-metoxy-1,4-benzoquinol methylase
MTRLTSSALPPIRDVTADALREQHDRAWFELQQGSNADFWNRIGEQPNLTDASVLDLGCGLGALSANLAQRGAREVLGLDVDPHPIAFATRFIPEAYPALANKIQFACRGIETLEDGQRFDFVFSKDAFEHILDLEGMVSHIHRLLRPGGRLVIGTSPLYFSPFGDHETFSNPRIPFLTAIVPERILFRFAGWRTNRDFRSASDAGLNKMTPAQFRSLFPASNWRIESIRYNAGNGRLVESFFGMLRSIPLLEKYFTVSIYTVMTRL